MSGCDGCRLKQLNESANKKSKKICCQRKGAEYFHKEIIIDEDNPKFNPDFECVLREPYESDWIKTALRYDAMGHCIRCYYHVWIEKEGKVVDICEIDGLSIDKILLNSDTNRKKANHMDNKCPVQKMKMKHK
jgi:hypothetical protein